MHKQFPKVYYDEGRDRADIPDLNTEDYHRGSGIEEYSQLEPPEGWQHDWDQGSNNVEKGRPNP